MDFQFARVEDTLATRLDLTRVKNYEAYFDQLRPRDQLTAFRRGLFAYASVHTTWKKNIDLYSRLWAADWMDSVTSLRRRVSDSGAGLMNNRTAYITHFKELFTHDPGFFLCKEATETWHEYRNRIERELHGLGPAKTAFFLELVHFHDCRCVCMDTHMLQLYGVKPARGGGPKRAVMEELENHWDKACEKLGINPVTARWIYWDMKQGKPDSRYWSHVLEGTPVVADQTQMWLFPEYAG